MRGKATAGSKHRLVSINEGEMFDGKCYHIGYIRWKIVVPWMFIYIFSERSTNNLLSHFDRKRKMSCPSIVSFK